MLAFAEDAGDFVFFYDPDDRLGRGAWAIFLIAKSASSIDRAWYVARDLAELERRVREDDTLLDDRSR